MLEYLDTVVGTKDLNSIFLVNLNPTIKIISRANRAESIKKLKQVGANHTIVPFKLAGLIAVEFIGQPVAFEAIYDILSGKHHIVLETITIRENSLLEKQSLDRIDFWKNKVQLFGVITQNERKEDTDIKPFALKLNYFYFNPSADFMLESGDILLVIGHSFSIVHLKN